MKIKTLLLFSSLVSCGFAAYLLSGKDDGSVRPQKTPVPQDAITMFDAEPSPSWVSESLVQEYSVSNYREVVVFESIQDANGDWTNDYYPSSASFDITATCSSGRNLFYFAGEDKHGSTVVQAWTLKNVGLPGGKVTKVMAKKELYRGIDIHPPRAMGADLDRRFLFLVGIHSSGDQVITQIDLPSGGSPAVFLTGASGIPIDHVTIVTPFEDSNLGHAWLFWGMPNLQDGIHVSNPAIALVDSENDLDFEGVHVNEYDTLSAQGLTPNYDTLIRIDGY